MNEVATQVPGAGKGPGDAVDWGAVRARYPAAGRWTYLHVASRGVLSNAARAAAEQILDDGSAGNPGDWPAALQAARERFARLIRAADTEIAVTRNVSEGINAVAAAVDWQPGDNVVFCPELEHPNNIYCWQVLEERGVELRMVPAREGAIDTGAMAAAIDRRTRVVTTSSVTFTPGFRTDLAALGRACRDAGTLFLVDAVQSLGVLDLNVEDAGVDALATSASKGLLGPAGVGFLFVRQAWAERLRPAYVARFSVERGAGHESEMENRDFRRLPNARRFEIGNYNYIGLAAVQASLGELLDIGIPAIEGHAVSLASDLAEGLTALGLPVTVPPAGAARSHIVTVGRLGAGDAYSSHDPRLKRLAAALTGAGVRFSVRRGLVRFAFHCYSDDSDVARVLEVAKRTG
jgi:selenocysteine lyase/cysteine desulfurase